MHPDDQEAVLCMLNSGFGELYNKMRMRDGRNAWPNKITTNAIETLRSDLNEMSAKMADEVACLKNRYQGSAASTVSGSTWSGGNMGHFTSRLMQNTFVASRIELKVGAAGKTFEKLALRWETSENLLVRLRHP